MSKLILTKAQAEAVYSAMCALNNVGAYLRATLPDADNDLAIVVEHHPISNKVSIMHYDKPSRWESYDNQAAFAYEYGL